MNKILKMVLYIVVMTVIILPIEIVTAKGYAKIGEWIMGKMNLKW